MLIIQQAQVYVCLFAQILQFLEYFQIIQQEFANNYATFLWIFIRQIIQVIVFWNVQGEHLLMINLEHVWQDAQEDIIILIILRLTLLDMNLIELVLIIVIRLSLVKIAQGCAYYIVLNFSMQILYFEDVFQIAMAREGNMLIILLIDVCQIALHYLIHLLIILLILVIILAHLLPY